MRHPDSPHAKNQEPNNDGPFKHGNQQSQKQKKTPLAHDTSADSMPNLGAHCPPRQRKAPGIHIHSTRSERPRLPSTHKRQNWTTACSDRNPAALRDRYSASPALHHSWPLLEGRKTAAIAGPEAEKEALYLNLAVRKLVMKVTRPGRIKL